MKLIIDETTPSITCVKIGCGELFIVIGFDTDGKIRFFFEVSHNGGGCQGNLTALASTATIFFNDGRFNPEKLIKEWAEISCDNCQRQIGRLLGEGKEIKDHPKSCSDAISRVLAELEIRRKK